jgi:hypothetical protein
MDGSGPRNRKLVQRTIGTIRLAGKLFQANKPKVNALLQAYALARKQASVREPPAASPRGANFI